MNPALSRRFLGPGDKLGACALIRQLAAGEWLESYLGRTLGPDGLEELVVVKRVLPPYRDDPRCSRTFLEEARRARALHHPNIARVFEASSDAGESFVAMEYIHGEALQRVIATGSEHGIGIPLDAALTVVATACAALNYAHAKAGPDGRPLHVVHHDIAPSNVLVTYDGVVKLVDFGIARARSAPSTASLPYSSPEQCRGAALDRRSDLYSLGVVLYELTTGRSPFEGEGHTRREVPRPTTIVPGYPPALEAILLRALALDPQHRHRSAVELQSDLEDFAHDHGLRISPLALARLMSSLFPQRLEDWERARKRGAFFVEQHVLSTVAEEPAPVEPPPPPRPALRALSPVPPTAMIATAPRPANDGETSIVAIRAPSRQPLLALGVAAIAGAAIAIAIVLGSGGEQPVAASQGGSAPVVDHMIAPMPEPVIAPPDATFAEPVVVGTDEAAEPEPEPELELAPATTRPAPKRATTRPLVKKRSPSKKPVRLKRPAKEPGWNDDDSPFLPVRPGP